jgi:hypothetical protein
MIGLCGVGVKNAGEPQLQRLTTISILYPYFLGLEFHVSRYVCECAAAISFDEGSPVIKVTGEKIASTNPSPFGGENFPSAASLTARAAVRFNDSWLGLYVII